MLGNPVPGLLQMRAESPLGGIQIPGEHRVEQQLVVADDRGRRMLQLPAADFLLLALPLTPATARIVGPAELALLRADSWLVNLGRGALVDEQALISALRAEAIGGAALDVFEQEPLPSGSPLWTLPNVIVSPHMSADFRGWDRALAELFLRQLASFRSGRPLANVVDKHLGFVTGASR